MQNNPEKLIEQKKYSEYLKVITEKYKKDDSAENADKLRKAEKMYKSYEQYKEYTSKERKNFYQILDVEKNATQQEIKENYKKLVLKFHPDRSFIPETNDLFLKIQSAYSTLNNERSKKEYDDKLNSGFNTHFDQNIYNRNNVRFYTNEVFFQRDFSPFNFAEHQFEFYNNLYNLRRNAHRREINEQEKVKAYFFILIFVFFYILSYFA